MLQHSDLHVVPWYKPVNLHLDSKSFNGWSIVYGTISSADN